MRSPRDSGESWSDMSFRKDSGENTTKIMMQKIHSCLKLVLPLELWERNTNIGGRNNMLLKNSTDPESCQTSSVFFQAFFE